MFIDNIFSYLLTKNNIFAVNKKSKQLIVVSPNNKDNSVFELLFSPTYLYETFDKSVLIVDDVNRLSCIYKDWGFTNITTNMRLIIQKQDNNFFVYYTRENGVKSIGIFDYRHNKVLWEKELSTALQIVDNFVLNLTLTLNRYDLENGNLLWQFSVSDFPSYKNYCGEEIKAEIRQIIGVYNNILWLYISVSHLVGIDVETGEKVYHIDDITDFLGLKEKEAGDFIGLDCHLDEQNGVIKAFAYRYYFEIDLNALQGKIKKDFGEDFQSSWRIRCGRYYPNDKNLYFVGARRGEAVNRAVGIFDTESCEVIWYDEPLEEKKFLFFTDAPQANEKYLGVLDSENNLRIYEQ
ncbi:MAG: hypothetical protein LBO74_10730 [Candidatus Symbiothrix sp.]|nr:hypothetical protein [Candidatus Symbiothrix sp.]